MVGDTVLPEVPTWWWWGSQLLSTTGREQESVPLRQSVRVLIKGILPGPPTPLPTDTSRGALVISACSGMPPSSATSPRTLLLRAAHFLSQGSAERDASRTAPAVPAAPGSLRLPLWMLKTPPREISTEREMVSLLPYTRRLTSAVPSSILKSVHPVTVGTPSRIPAVGASSMPRWENTRNSSAGLSASSKSVSRLAITSVL